MVSVGERMWIEHLIFVRRDKPNQWVPNKQESSVLFELGSQLLEVGGLWNLVDVPVWLSSRFELRVIL